MKPTIFTPNVTRGCGNDGMRYLLYRHGPHTFSATPRGKTFEAHPVRDACGLGCKCGAFLTDLDEFAPTLLAQARQITPTEMV